MATYRERRDSKGNRTIAVRIALKGHEPVYFTAPNKTVARQLAEKMEADIRAGRLRPAEMTRTVADLISAYKTEVLPVTNDGPTWKARKAVVLDYWSAEIGHLKLSEVSGHHIATVRRKMLREGTAPSTTNRYLAILSSAFKAGKRELGWLKHNPCSDVERMDERGRERKRHLSPEEYQLLMDSCEDACKGTDVEPEFLRTIIDIAIETGGRRAKVEGLMWSNVNLSWSTMGTDDDSGTVTFQSTKNKDDVVVPIAGSALDRLRALARAKVRRVDTNLVFPRRDGKRPVHTIRAFNKALKLSGINNGVDEVVVFHSLRHTTGTMILEAGGSTRDVMEILGQRTEVMARRYAHATVPHKLKIARKLAARKAATGS